MKQQTCFKKNNRLLKAAQFKTVLKSPKVCSSAYWSFFVKANLLPQARLGISVPKHRVKKAVHRNQLKRYLREQFRHHQAELEGLDIVVLVRKNFAQVHAKQQRLQMLNQQWQNLRKSSERL